MNCSMPVCLRLHCLQFFSTRHTWKTDINDTASIQRCASSEQFDAETRIIGYMYSGQGSHTNGCIAAVLLSVSSQAASRAVKAPYPRAQKRSATIHVRTSPLYDLARGRSIVYLLEGSDRSHLARPVEGFRRHFGSRHARRLTQGRHVYDSC